MTPASSDRYQSRLFRFVYKQSRRFTQQCDRAWRNLQSTASWVAAVGLYPLFVLIQSRRSTANQVHQAVEKTLHQLPADDTGNPAESQTVDTPIRQVLLYVTGAGEERAEGAEEAEEAEGEKIAHHATTNYQSPTTNHSIRGIASELSSRSLVLVTAQNQTLEVIDPQQQDSIQEEIMTAIARYWQYRRNRNQFPLTTPPWLTSLDHTVAEVESHHLVRVKSAAIAFYQSIFAPSTELADFKRPTTDVRTEESSKTRTTKILSLIWAAIDYFFGTGDRAVRPISHDPSRNGVNPFILGKSIPVKPQFAATRPTAQLPVSHTSTDEDLEDPWLRASDLFGEIATETTGDPSNSPYKGGQQSTAPISRLHQGAIKKILPPFSRGVGGLGAKANSTEGEKISPPFSRGIEGLGAKANNTEGEKILPPFSRGVRGIAKATTNNISTSASKTSSVQATPDWIETPATLMGYVKHPLEQILAWLDRAMLWIEESLVKFWQWMQKMWRKF